MTEPDLSDMNKMCQVSRLFMGIIVNKEGSYPFRMTVLIALFVLWISLITVAGNAFLSTNPKTEYFNKRKSSSQ